MDQLLHSINARMDENTPAHAQKMILYYVPKWINLDQHFSDETTNENMIIQLPFIGEQHNLWAVKQKFCLAARIPKELYEQCHEATSQEVNIAIPMTDKMKQEHLGRHGEIPEADNRPIYTPTPHLNTEPGQSEEINVSDVEQQAEPISTITTMPETTSEEIDKAQYIVWNLPSDYDLPAVMPDGAQFEKLQVNENGARTLWGIEKGIDLLEFLLTSDHHKMYMRYNENLEELIQQRTRQRAQTRKQELQNELEPMEKHLMLKISSNERQQEERKPQEDGRTYKCVYCIGDYIEEFSEVNDLKRHILRCRGKYLQHMQKKEEIVDWTYCPHSSQHMIPELELQLHKDLLCNKREFNIELEEMLQKFTLENSENQKSTATSPTTSNGTDETLPDNNPDVEYLDTPSPKEATTSKVTRATSGIPELKPDSPLIIELPAHQSSDIIKVEGKLMYIEAKSAPHGFKVHLTLFPVIIAILTMIMGSNAWPMVCTNTQGKTQWHIPNIQDCSTLIKEEHVSRPQPGTLQLYRRNHLKYTSNAWVCKRMKQTKQLYTYFWNTDHLERNKLQQVPISEQDCNLMMKYKRSTRGSLGLKNGIWATTNKLLYIMPPGFMSCCKWKTFTVENDFLYPSTIWKDHDVEKATSSAGNIEHCGYHDGKCALSSGAYLMWKPNTTENCQFLPWKTITGNSYGRFFVADKENIAFSLEDLIVGKDCNMDRILIPPQGIPFKVISSREPYLRKIYHTGQELQAKHPRARRQTSRGAQLRKQLNSLTSQRQLVKDEIENPKQDTEMVKLRQKDKQLNEQIEATVKEYFDWIKTTAPAAMEKTESLHENGTTSFQLELSGSTNNNYQGNGLVTTDLLAVELQSQLIHTYRDINFIFKQLVKQICRTTQNNLRLIMFNLLNHPTLAIRHILNRNDIEVKAGAGHLLEVYPCHSLKPTEFRLLPMIEPCTERIPIAFHIDGSPKLHHGLLDPLTNVIHHVSMPADCEERDEIPIRQGNTFYIYRRTDGRLQPTKEQRDLPIGQWDQWSIHIPEPMTIKQLLMYQWSELQHPYQISEMIQESEKTKIILKHLGLDVEQLDVNSPEVMDKTATHFANRIIKKGFWSWSATSIAEWVLLIVVIIVVITAITMCCCPKACSNFILQNFFKIIWLIINFIIGLIRGTITAILQMRLWIRSRKHGRARQRRRRRNSSRQRLSFSELEPAVHYSARNERLQIRDVTDAESIEETTPGTPTGVDTGLPAIRNIRQINNTTEDEQPWKIEDPNGQIIKIPRKIRTLKQGKSQDADIVVNIGGQETGALIDTGADKSCVSRKWIQEKKPNGKHQQTMGKYTGITGTLLKVLGTITLSVVLPRFTTHQAFLIVDNMVVDIILGRDFLLSLGTPYLVIREKNLYIPLQGLPQQAILRSERTVTIPEGQGAIISCKVNTPVSGCSFFEPLYTWQTKFIGITPGVLQLEEGNCCIQVNNHSDKPQRIFMGQKLGKVTPQQQSRIGMIRSCNQENDQQKKNLSSELDLSHLSSRDAQSLKMLCQNNRDAFAITEKELGESEVAQLELDVQGHPPIRIRPRDLSHTERMEAAKIIDNLLETGVVVPSAAAWSSPIVMVQKKSGAWRLCVDYRRLNKITAPVFHNIKKISTIISNLGKAKIFSSLDLRSGYYQLKVHPNSQDYTTFSDGTRTMKFTRMPFGLQQAPGIFSMALEQVLNGIQYQFAISYLDDILVFSENMDDHIKHLQEIFSRLKKHNLKLNPSKCKWAKDTVIFLGH
ncbi:MAG: hypothetical protein GY820_27770 [Gammaproteobacteria bacterium]|nr:hypothetical protein [Gammaproteobacteria bacterium]